MLTSKYKSKTEKSKILTGLVKGCLNTLRLTARYLSSIVLSHFVCLSAHLSVYLSVCLSVAVSLSVYLCPCLSICHCLCLCLCLSLSVSVSLCVFLSLSVCLCLSLVVYSPFFLPPTPHPPFPHSFNKMLSAVVGCIKRNIIERFEPQGRRFTNFHYYYYYY